MDNHRKQALKEYYKHYKATQGVVAIRCLATGDEFVEVALDTEKIFNSHYAKLQHHWHPNKALQALWDQYGKDGFERLVLHEFEEDEADPAKNAQVELEAFRESYLAEHSQAQKIWK